MERDNGSSKPKDEQAKEPDPAEQPQELSDELLDSVAGGGNQPTATIDSTGSIKTI